MAMGGEGERGYRIGIEEAASGFIIPTESYWIEDSENGTLRGGGGRIYKHPLVSAATAVRRLTPTECERLQALPDGWTDLGGTPDSRRYAGLGDAVTASVAEWIGRRIIAVSAPQESEQ